MRLKTPLPWLLVSLCVLAALLAVPARASAEDRVLIRGNYYRETSTRVLQPQISYSKDLPDERLTLGVDYLMDVISSASIGAGALQLGGDEIFTEMRHEATLRVGSRIGDWGLGSFFRYSNETDYNSRAFGLSVSRDLAQRTVTLSGSYSYANDRAFRIRGFGDRVAWKSLVPRGDGSVVNGPTNLVESHYLSLGYTQVWTRWMLSVVTVEGTVTNGPQDNPYRRSTNQVEEVHPLLRRRFATTGAFKFAIPKARMVIEPRYRFYQDDWAVTAHAIDTRLHFRVVKPLRLRLRYRYYTQDDSFFVRQDGNYLVSDRYRTADPKMLAFRSHTPGVELTFQLEPLSRFKGLKWLENSWVQATYNHVFQTSRFGNARVGSLAWSVGF